MFVGVGVVRSLFGPLSETRAERCGDILGEVADSFGACWIDDDEEVDVRDGRLPCENVDARGIGGAGDCPLIDDSAVSCDVRCVFNFSV